MYRASKITRRQFLHLSGLGLGGLAVTSLLSACGVSLEPETIAPLGSTAAPAPGLATPSSTGGLVEISLRAARASYDILLGGETRVWQYQGSLLQGPPASLQTLPDSYLGPILRLHRGQTLKVHFENQINEPSIIHWHGLSVPDEMDGHPRHAIEHGQSYTYEFPILNRAGTYWFHPHPHQRTGPQAYYGLAGLLIVSDDETTLTVIATDGGLLEKPVTRDYITLAPGERVELYADFSADPIGTQRRLVSLAFEGGGGGMGV